MDVKDELVELLTIQIALDDKIHKVQKVLANLAIRIKVLEDEIREKVST
jgi:hypothetical protein